METAVRTTGLLNGAQRGGDPEARTDLQLEMIKATNQYNPDYAVPPGWVLEEELEARGISQSRFARLCGLSAKLINDIIAGKAPIEPETAVQFGRVLGRGPDIWLRMKSTYRLRPAPQKETLPRESDI